MKLNQAERAEFAKVLNTFMDFAGSTFASATFVKRNGEERTIVFNPRMGREGTPMRNDLTNGEGMAYDPLSRGLLPVVDMVRYKNGFADVWRMVNFNTLKCLRARGHVFNF